MTGFIAPDFDREKIPGLPGPLPAGERLVWQGKPDRALVARHIFKIRWIMAYFGVLAAWLVVTGVYFGRDGVAFATSLGMMAVACALVCGFVYLVSWGIAKTTVYTITSKRVVMRFGIALPKAFNLPFAEIESASMVKRDDGTGALALLFKPDIRLSYLVFMPHIRGLRMGRPEPQFIAQRNVSDVAAILAEQLSAYAARVHNASDDVVAVNVARHDDVPMALAGE